MREIAERTAVIERERVYFLDGLRGWAAITVMLYHIVLAFPDLDFLGRSPLLPFINGAYAVDIFFTLSGVVLSMEFFRRRETKILSALAIKRLPRLTIPILVSCAIIALLMKYGAFYNIKAAQLLGGDNNWLAAHYNFGVNFIEAVKFAARDVFFNYEFVNSYNGSLWTMRWELSGSYLVVIILLFYKHLSANRVLWALISAYIFIISGILFMFLLGILASYLYVNHIERIKSVKFAGLIAPICCVGGYAAAILCEHFKFLRLQELMYAASAFFLILSIFLLKAAREFLSMKISRFLGKISFPLYIVHVPVICSFTSYLIVKFGYAGDNLKLTFFIVLTLIVSLAAATLLYPVEKTAVKFSGWLAKRALKN